MDLTFDDIIPQYYEALAKWDLAKHKELAKCSSRDERDRASSQFIIDHEDEYLELMKMTAMMHILDKNLDERHIESHEVRAGIRSAAELIGQAESSGVLAK